MKNKFQPKIEELADISAKLAVRLSEDEEIQKLFLKYTEKLTVFCVEYTQAVCKDSISMISIPEGVPDDSVRAVPAVENRKA